MKSKGRLKAAERLYSGKYILTLEIDRADGLEALNGVDLDVTVDKHRERRSLNANALLWKCLGDIASALNADKWDIYLKMLRRYGEFTYVCVPPRAVGMLKRQWRECEEIGHININGKDAVQLLCYYGSSTYDSKQFSRLLDGVISEMKEMGLQTPDDEDMRHCIQMLEEQGWNDTKR